MLLWFIAIAASGIVSIFHTPSVLKAVNPDYAVKFMIDNGLAGFFVLSEVILCATGGEALYADMGHLGRAPILKAWRMVFIALVLSYIGQGAFILRHPDSTNILFEMIFQQAPILYVPFLTIGNYGYSCCVSSYDQWHVFDNVPGNKYPYSSNV